MSKKARQQLAVLPRTGFLSLLPNLSNPGRRHQCTSDVDGQNLIQQMDRLAAKLGGKSHIA